MRVLAVQRNSHSPGCAPGSPRVIDNGGWDGTWDNPSWSNDEGSDEPGENDGSDGSSDGSYDGSDNEDNSTIPPGQL